MTERPAEFPEWASNADSLIKAPSIEKRKIGYSIDTTTGLTDIPSLRGENWFRNLVYKWIKYLDEKISSINTNISYLSISDKEKQLELNKWHDLKSFVVPKGRWFFTITFRQSISNRDVQLENKFQSPIFVCGITPIKGSLAEFSDNLNEQNVKKILASEGVGNNLYSSFLAKEYEQGNLGTAVENVGYSCVIDVPVDTNYYVKDLCFTIPYIRNDTAIDLYKVFYQINAIKIG
ncbi:hypothetical protein [Fluviispira vulneris]|uniref:hypothetical protein n=1 Tax=Fluviispira vulneris TaxID=2763012 RepID=UPI0016493FF6|nr:hypothetical protein [Fluviispira vulneris]